MKDYSNIGSVCFDCAKKAGFKFNKTAASVWTDECGICYERKSCTNLWRDWVPIKKKRGEGMNEEEFSAEYLRMKETYHEFFSAIRSYITKMREDGYSSQDACLVPSMLVEDMNVHIRFLMIELLNESSIKK